mgnify:CR=1 FL=1
MAVQVNLSKGLDKAYEDKSLDEILAAPPSALAGLTEAHDKLLAELGHEVSASGVARYYDALVNVWVIDEVDRALAPALERLGKRVLVTDTIMSSADHATRLAGELLQFIDTLERA